MNRLVTGIGVLLLGVAGLASSAQPSDRGYVPKTERGKAAGQIMRKWAGYVQSVYGTSPMDWAASMRSTFAEADLKNLVDASRRTTYEAMMGTLLGQQTSDSKVIDAMAKSDGSLAVIKTLGSPSGDLVYTMVTPCRIMDTRVAGGRLSAAIERSIAVHGANFTAQGGSNTNCGIPADPSAVAINVAAVIPDGTGFLSVYPGGTARPSASNMNYTAGGILSNEIISKTTLGQPNDLTLYSQWGSDVVVDIVGYFMAPEATALQCTSAADGTPTSIGPNSVGNSTSSACPIGYTIVGGECNTGLTTSRIVDEDINASTFNCEIFNGSGSLSETLTAVARCCRVPGR